MNDIKKIIVSKNENSEFKTINDALTYANNFDEVLLYIEDGQYYEKIDIRHKNITLEGQSRENTIITYDDYAFKKTSDGDDYGTFRTYTINTASDNITFKNLTIKNTAGIGEKVGQAVALSLCAKNSQVINCTITAYQDTIFMSPFPPSPIIKGSFKGDNDRTPELHHKNYFENCYVSGDIDFIFGGGVAYFNECEIYSNDLDRDVNGYVTAPSTYEGFKYGFVFDKCKFTSDAKEETVYLSRPWRNFAKAVFLNCDFGKHIKREGFHDWDKLDAHDTVFYAEYNCTGEGSDLTNRVDFAKTLTYEQSLEYTKEKVLGYQHQF